jgi:hypothetical protein
MLVLLMSCCIAFDIQTTCKPLFIINGRCVENTISRRDVSQRAQIAHVQLQWGMLNLLRKPCQSEGVAMSSSILCIMHRQVVC